MIRRNPNGDLPDIHADAFVDPTAIICGKVVVERHVFIGPYAVIRADETDDQGNLHPIHIGEGTNIQDGVVMHSKDGGPISIGRNSSIAHRAIVHGPCRVGDSVFVGFNSVLFNCTIGDCCAIRHNAVIDGMTLPENFYIPSTSRIGPDTDISSIPRVNQDITAFSESVSDTNKQLVQGYKRIQNEL